MKKKFLGILLFAATAMGLGIATSCSDTIADLKVEVMQDLLSKDSPLYEVIKQQTKQLEDQLNQLRQDFEAFKQAVKQCNCDEEAMKQKIEKVAQDLASAEQRLTDAINNKADASTVNDLVNQVANLNTQLVNLKTYLEQTYVTKATYENAIQELKDAIAQIKQCSCDMTQIYTRLASVELLAGDAMAKANEAYTLAEQNAQLIVSLQTQVGANTTAITNLTQVVEGHTTSITELENKYTLLDARILEAVAKAAEALAKAQADSALLAGRLDILEEHSEIVDGIIAKLDGKVDSLAQVTTVLNESVTSMGLSITELQTRTEYLYSRTDSLAEACTQALEDAKAYADQQIAGVLLSIANLDSIAESHDGRLSALESLTGDHEQKLEQLFASTELLDSIVGAHGENLAYLDSLTNAQGLTIGELQAKTDSLFDICDALNDSIVALNGRVDDLELRVAELETQVAELVTKVDNILKVLSEQLNGIIIQGSHNPAFGSLALPTGLNSKMLMAYYGEALTDVYFPTQRTGNYVRPEQALTAKDMQMLAIDTDPIFYTGEWMMSSEDYNAGTLYVTINPNTVNCEGVTLKIENSQAVESGVKLMPLARSTKKLPFGWTRAAENSNGFYEAKAFIADPTKVQHVNLNTAKMKEIVKEIYNKRQNSDMLLIASDLYSILSDLNLDRNAIKASYKNVDAEGNIIESTIYSPYELAATTVKPLSLESYKDLNYTKVPGFDRANRFLDKIGDKLKSTVGRVVDRIGNHKIFEHIAELKLRLKKIDFKGFTEERLGQLDITIDKTIVFDGQECTISFENPVEVTIENNSGATTIVYEVRNARGVLLGYVDLTNLTTDLVGSLDATDVKVVLSGLEYHLIVSANIDSLKDMLTEINGELEDAIDDVNDVFEGVRKLCDDVNDLLDMMYDYETKFDNKVDNLLDKVRDYLTRFNNKIVRFINNTNQRFQPILLARTTDRVISISGAKSQPTIVKKSITLTPTTRSFELAVPLCKKHVGVTNVIKGEASAQDGNAACIAALNAANSATNMNKVISADIRRIELDNLTPGYTYEIAYSGLDFHGKLATYKYYIEVVE